MADDSTLVISHRFNGPPGSANGGYACGLAVRALLGEAPLGRTAAVTLHAPPPLDVPLTLRPDGRWSHLWSGPDLVATVSRAAPAHLSIEPVAPEVSGRAAARFPGRRAHPFPTCFVCGHDRPDDDGYALDPGPVPGLPNTVACLWRPTSNLVGRPIVPLEFVWAVLDCTGGWAGDPVHDPMVLIRMTATITALPHIGGTYVLAGTLDRRHGPVMDVTTALFDAAGLTLAHATARWMSVHASRRHQDDR